ncbi:hypothetical protein PTKU64_87300 [Paraburkholderia terrae]|uniref:Uncharacterized protein n=2 Tax=Paraburkholderia terrae TaxID=311230 RepID=A0ABN6JVQ1_9BURK|nr:hypothetical protein PTKU64_87300 [Paraburkholderia terrae]BDC45016.1 hypothetical protein PTKU15_83130 [Paraburkholderia terrae]
MRAVAIAQRGAVRMKRVIDDLLVFTRTRLGDTLPVDFTAQDIGRICNVDAAGAGYVRWAKADIAVPFKGVEASTRN